MIKNLLSEKKEYIFTYFLIIFLPLFIVTSSLLMNLNVVLISFLFIFISFKEKNFELIKDKFFIFILIFFLFLLINLYNSIEVSNSLKRTLGFLRFIFLPFALAYFISLKNFKHSKIIFLSWLVIFIFVSVDLLIEFIFGRNIFGFSNQFPGRLSGLLNDELKIGGYYFGFILITISSIFYFYKKKLGIVFLIFFLIIALLIGERSNFIKIMLSTFLFLIFLNILSKKLKIILSILLITSSFLIVVSNAEIKNRFKNQFVSYIFENGVEHYYYNSVYGAHYNSAFQIIFRYLFLVQQLN